MSSLRQQAVLLAYTAFAAQAESSRALGGRLVLLTGLADEGIATALGATLAGAAVLALDPKVQIVKQSVREGGCDFMVNTLDEALRILKNQIRQQRPVSVGVPADIAPMLQQIVDRGLQPEYIVSSEAMHTLIDRGSRHLNLSSAAHDWAAQHSYILAQYSADTNDALRELDQAALNAMPEADWVRRRWLEQAPKYFRRQAPERHLWLTAEESAQLLPR